MGRQHIGTSLGGVARISTLALGCFLLAHCSGPFGSKVVDDSEPVPKGGGGYRVGKPYNINGRTYFPTENPSYRAEGIASWYGPDFHRRATANGEVYDMHGISAAHPTMPLPSYARVTNLGNGRSIIVRVNDRGPYARNRIIDLSIGTAKALAFYGHGLARVRVEYIGRAPLEGSDDRMLLATLREGEPAPAPSKVMVASAKPFLPNVADGKELPSERPVTVGVPGRIVEPASAIEVTSSTRARAKSSTSGYRTEASAASAPAPRSGPVPNDAAALGLMSGRGLY